MTGSHFQICGLAPSMSVDGADRKWLAHIQDVANDTTGRSEVAIAIAPRLPPIRSALEAMKTRLEAMKTGRVPVGFAGIATVSEGDRTLNLETRWHWCRHELRGRSV